MSKILIDKEITGYPLECKTVAMMNAAKVISNIGNAFLFTGASDGDYIKDRLYILQTDLTFKQYLSQDTIGLGDYIFYHYMDHPMCILDKFTLPQEALGLHVCDEIRDGVPYYQGEQVQY